MLTSMNSAVPWWGVTASTVIVATLGFAGILWTQYRADRRASELQRLQRVESQTDVVRRALEEFVDACMTVLHDAPGFSTQQAQLHRVAVAELSVRMFGTQTINKLTDVLLLKVGDYMTAVQEHGENSAQAHHHQAASTQLIKSLGVALRGQVARTEDVKADLDLSWDGKGSTSPAAATRAAAGGT